MLLPAPGRDEAAYYLWSHHPEPAYAPLLQLLLRVFELAGAPPLVAIRLPSLLSGLLVIWLFDRLLRLRRAEASWRILSLSILALSPWQTYGGSILHPDNLLLAAILAMQLLAVRHRYHLAAIAAAAAFWAKPTGILISAVFLLWIWRSEIATRQKGQLLIFLGIMILPVLLSFNAPIIEAIAEFSRMGEDVAIWRAALVQILTVLLLAGPAICLVAGATIWKMLRKPDFSILDEDSFIAFTTLSIFLCVFGAAILLTGQIKGNWLIPALVLIWPARIAVKLKRPLIIGFMIALCCSITLTLGMSRPDLVENLEEQLPHWRNSYSLQAGTREARVSASSSWSDRLNEYQPLGDFSTKVLNRWQTISGTNGYPDWIISDDYGLAAQLLFDWDYPDGKMIIPDDGIFYRMMPPASLDSLSGGILLLGVQQPLKDLWWQLPDIERVSELNHPVGGGSVKISAAKALLIAPNH